MNEGRAALLVLGAVAAITFAGAAILVLKSAVLREHARSDSVGAVAAAFQAAAARGASVVPDVGRLLPAGTPRRRVLERLAAEGFACTFEPNAATCFRSVGGGAGTDIWTLWLTFDSAETLTSSQGERRAPRR